jgi:hypothetical protein
MVLALVLFVRLWCATHPDEPQVAPKQEAVPIEVIPGTK